MGDPAQALADIVISLELQPRSSRALRTHARVSMAQGNYDEAIKIYIHAQEVWTSAESTGAERRMIAQELMDAEALLKTSRSKHHYEIPQYV